MNDDQYALGPRLMHPNLVRMYDYWCERRRGRDFPARSDIDPLDFTYALGNIELVDVSHDPLQFRYRLFGVNIAMRDGYDLTGKTVDEIPEPEFRALVRAPFVEVIELRRPLSAVRNRLIDGRPRRYEAVRMPLSDDGETINMIFIATEFLP